MAFNLTRMTVYALICAIEEDLRSIIIDNLKDDNLINSKLIARAKKRIEKDIGAIFDDLDFKDFVDYFDIGDTFQVINSNSSQFPPHISKKIKELTKRFEMIIPIRNRVMHIRPLNFDDLPIVTEFCNLLIRDDKVIWNNVEETLGRLNDDSSFVLSMEIQNLDNDIAINHNLPLPDFDETGLIGRDDIVKQVKDLCLGGFPVISIVGEGGIGKTALALKVAYELLDDSNAPFDAIVWVSSKTSQITVNEIKDIKGAIADSLGVIQEISNQVVDGATPASNLDEVIEYLATFKIALFIDNLETILDENIRNFVSSLPQGSKIIITSRIGLGAYEYPIKLQGIDESYASQLLRLLAKLRNVDSIAKLSENILRKYVNRMHRNPSYIKWFISSVQTGLSPEAVLQNSDLFLEFCMSNVYDYLSDDSKIVTAAFQCAPGYKDLPELSFLTGFDSLRIQKAIQKLMSTNMLTECSKVKGASVKNTYQLSILSRSYLGKHHKPTKTFQNNIRQKRNKLNSIFEMQVSNNKNCNKYFMHNIQFRDKSDRVVSKMLHDSQKSIKMGAHDKAYEILDEARRLAPDYFEVARVMAFFYQRAGNLNDAREQYELALILSPRSPQLNYWFGKFLLHEEENVDEAVIQFEKAFALDSESLEVGLYLARGYMFQHDFPKSRDILKKLYSHTSEADDRHLKIYHDTDIQIHYRTADDLTSKGDFSGAMVSLREMRNVFDGLPSKIKDTHIRRKLNKCEYTFSRISRTNNSEFTEELASFREWVKREARR